MSDKEGYVVPSWERQRYMLVDEPRVQLTTTVRVGVKQPTEVDVKRRILAIILSNRFCFILFQSKRSFSYVEVSAPVVCDALVGTLLFFSQSSFGAS